jgi:hypothetical protein
VRRETCGDTQGSQRPAKQRQNEQREGYLGRIVKDAVVQEADGSWTKAQADEIEKKSEQCRRLTTHG